jgi:hypothetical protein
MPKGFEVVLSRRNDNTSNPYIRVAVIRINGVVLRNNKKVVNHSPTGFEWGYGGSGPAQAAACICYELFKQATDYPGWKVKIDGKSHPLHSLDGYLAVDLQPGVHKYEFSFQPASFYWGLLISLAALAEDGGEVSWNSRSAFFGWQIIDALLAAEKFGPS